MVRQPSRAALRPYLRTLGAGCAAAAAALALGACGKTSSSSAPAASSTASASTGAASAQASGCGSTPKLPYHDESGVLAGLGSTYTSQFNGYPSPIYKSAWAHYKPHGSGHYTIGVVVSQPIDPIQAATITQLDQQLKTVKGVTKVTTLQSSPSGVTQQLQQANSLLQQHVTILVAEALAPPAFVGIAAKAKAADIPMISIVNSTPTPNAINIAPNSVADAAKAGARVAQLIHGKGLVLGVHAIPGTGVDEESFKGFKAAFAKCPGIKLDDSLTGDFQSTVAKQALLTYLSSHPQPVAAVVQTAGMGTGIIQAFQQAGRPLPVVVDSGPAVGDLAFWKDHPGKLADAYTITPSGTAGATTYTVKQLLSGHGPKISELSQMSLNIDQSNLSKFIPAGAKFGDQQAPEGPWLPVSYLAKLFNG